MKKLITTLAIFIFALVFSTPNADARSPRHHYKSHTYVSGHTSCGCKIYTKRIVRYYDNCGYPVYGYYRQPVKHYCQNRRSSRKSYSNYYGYGSSYGYSNHRRSYYRNHCGTRSGLRISYSF